jgi:ribosome maturation factor RimP
MTRWALGPLAPELEAEIGEIAQAAGCELIHAEWKGGVLRLVLDRQARQAPAPEGAATEAVVAVTEGVTLADCEHVAKQTSALLDVLDFGNGRYLLEVSSPGLDRQLYRPSDYQRFAGRLARVTYETADPAEPGVTRRRTVVARLAEFQALPPAPAGAAGNGESAAAPASPASAASAGAAPATVTLVDERTGERIVLQLEDVRQARLEVEL